MTDSNTPKVTWPFAITVALSLCSASCSTAGRVDSGANKEVTRTDRARMLVDIANGALVEGDPTGALQSLFAAEKEDASLPELHHSKAIAYFLKRDTVTAIVEARKAIELKPDYSEANNTLGKLLMDTGKPDEAIAPLNRSANSPVYREAYKPLTNLGIIYYRRGDYERAEQYLSRAVLDAPQTACVAYYYRGHLRLKDSRFQDALGDYESAGKRACAGFADAHLAIGITYERSKQYDLARRKYLEIGSRFPNTQVASQAVSHLRALP